MDVRAVPGYPGYCVSEAGVVYGKRGYALATRPNNYGYLLVNLRRGGRPKTELVSTVVATAFHGPRPEGCTLDHEDGNKRNNRADNLRWVLHSENVKRALRNGQRRAGLTLPLKAVKALRRLYKAGVQPKLLAEAFGVSSATVWSVGAERTWNHVSV